MSAAKKMMMGTGGGFEPVPIGTATEGGYYAGVIKIDGSNYAVIVAPKAAEVLRTFKTTTTATAGTQSLNNGMANSESMNNAEHPAALYCRSYNGGGYVDWYLPARDELEILYRSFKPSSDQNLYQQIRYDNEPMGLNNNSVPAGAAYGPSPPPGLTTVAAFQGGQSQAFELLDYYWASTLASGSACAQRFYDGYQAPQGITTSRRVRPIRKVPI